MSDTSLRFTRVELFEIDPGPLPVRFVDSTMGPFTHWTFGWLRLTADDGVIGQCPGYVNPLVLPALLSPQPLTLAQWWHKLWWMLRNSGHRNPATSCSMHAIDTAARDILSKRAGEPWHRFAGAQRDAVPVYGSGGGVNLSTDELIAEMCDLVRCGFRTLKMKVGTDFGTRMDDDVERVRAVREAIGSDIALAVDGNQTWTAEQAADFARSIERFNIAWFEEPVHSADRQALRDLCRQCPIPVAMGESENHWLGFRDLYECGVPHLQVGGSVLPGFDRWCDAVQWAEQAGPIWTGGGFTHVTAMLIATRQAGSVEYLRAIVGHAATAWAVKPAIENGMIHLPATPGLPIEPDWPGLQERHALRLLHEAQLGSPRTVFQCLTRFRDDRSIGG